MVSPIDYSINVESPFQSVLQGFKVGDFLQQRGVQQQQQALAQQQAQQQAAAQQQMQADLGAVAGNPNATGTDYARLMTQYPQLSEQLKRSWETLDSTQRQTRLNQAGQAYAALSSGNVDVAKNLFKDAAEAARNSGNAQEAAGAEAMLRTIEMNPDAARSSVAMTLISQVGPEKFAESFGKFGAEQRAQEQAPFALAEQKSKAEQAKYDTQIKAVAAKYADSNALLDQQKKGWDIRKIAEDIEISKEQNRIAAMNAAISRETNQLKKQELQQKVDEAKEKRDEKIREKVSTAEGAAASIDNLSNTVDRLLKNPSLNDVVGSIEGGTLGDMKAYLSPGDAKSDAISLIEQLGSQAFIAQIPQMKGTGALSEKEGDKLQASLQNLGRKQSESQFRYNLSEVQRLMGKARDRLQKTTGVPLSAPDRPNAPRQAADFAPAPAGTPVQPAAEQKNITVDF